jgi:dTDP-4-dehydrorhamnose reductase
MLGHQLWKRLRVRLPDTWTTLRGLASDYLRASLFDSDRVIYNTPLLDPHVLEETLNHINPEIIINCIAVTKRHIPDLSNSVAIANAIRLNAEMPHQIAAWANQRRARVIHFSTDCVFDGSKGGYTESDPFTAQDVYGLSKAMGELGANEGRCLTLRSSFIGLELFQKTELLSWFLCQKGKSILGYRQAIFSGVTTWVMADLVVDLIEKFCDLNGLYQVSSQPISKYELLCQMREIFDIEVRIEPEDHFICKRDLNGSRFSEITGFKAPPWDEMLNGIKKELQKGT